MSRPKPVSIQRVTSRPGEGAKLTVTSAEREADGGTTFTLDLLQAPVPDRRYAADSAAVFRTPAGFRLVFAQSKLGLSNGNNIELRSMIDIQMSNRAMQKFIDSLMGVRDALERDRGSPLPLLQEFIEPTQTAGLTANIVPVAISGPESCMDFYQLSPFTLTSIGNGGDIYAEPVVRVTLPTGLFFSVVARAVELTNSGNTTGGRDA